MLPIRSNGKFCSTTTVPKNHQTSYSVKKKKNSQPQIENIKKMDKQLEQMPKRITILKRSEKSDPVQIVEEDAKRSSFQPQLAQVKILKRQTPCTPCTTVVQNQSIGSRHQKSLAEREAAYAEARLRIFGCDKENDDDEQRSAPQLNEAIKTLNISEPVIQQPKGPDGTPGFDMSPGRVLGSIQRV